MLGEQVRVDVSETIWTILSVSYCGKEVNLDIPNTSLQRFRVMVADLVYIENPLPPKPKEPEKPERTSTNIWYLPSTAPCTISRGT